MAKTKAVDNRRDPRKLSGRIFAGPVGSLTVGDAPHGAFMRHFLAENDAKTTAMRHRFGQKRRRIAVIAKKQVRATA
jgi:hypothetical protein